jgi:hypothetical protein
MATRKPADPSARLKILQAALKQIKNGDTLNADEMAKAVGMTWRNLKLIIDSDPDFPIVSRGAEGIAWQFNARKAVEHMIGKCNAALGELRSRAERMSRLTGFETEKGATAGDFDDEPLSAGELKNLGDAQMAAHRLKLAQGKLIPAEKVRAFQMAYHAQMQAETLGIVAHLDPAGQWPVDLRRSVEDRMRTILVELQDRMAAFLIGFGAQNPA